MDMLSLSAPPIIMGIVIVLLTGMPRHMIKKNLYERGKFGENPDQLIAEAERKISAMLRWDTIPEEFVSLIDHGGL